MSFFKKSMVLGILSLASVSSYSAESLPPEQLLLIQEADGTPRLGISYSRYESIVFGSALWSGRQLLKGRSFYSLKMAYINRYTGARLTPWFDFEGRHAIYNGQMGTNLILSAEVALAVIPELRNSYLVFSLDSSPVGGEYPITHYIDIGAVCIQYPNAFQNVDDGTSGCP